MVPKNLGYFSRSSLALIECRGISSVVGASGWKTPSASHFAWICFSQATRASRFSVYINRVCEHEDQYITGCETYTLELLRLGDGHDNVWSRHDGWLLLAALVTRILVEYSQCQMYILSVSKIDSPPFVCGGLLVVWNARLRVCSRSKLSHAGR